MLPPLLLIVSLPPLAVPTLILSMLALPVPPEAVFTLIVAAFAVVFPVAIVPAVCDWPSVPVLSWLAARVTVPDTLPTVAASVIALLLNSETLPELELGIPAAYDPLVNVPGLAPIPNLKEVPEGTAEITNVPLYAAGVAPTVMPCPTASPWAAAVLTVTWPPAVPPLEYAPGLVVSA